MASMVAAAALLPGILVVPAGAAASGAVTPFGDAGGSGAPDGTGLAAPLVDVVATPDGGGYWLLGADGGVFSEGDAGFFGSEGGQNFQTPFEAMAATPDGRGYWVTTDAGTVFSFGSAPDLSGSIVFPAAPISGMVATPTGQGYWLVGQDGGVLSFGDAGFVGSMGGRPMAAPVVGMAATPDGGGYWLVGGDGGVFAFGDAGFFGSMGGRPMAAPVVGMAATPDGGGYWLVGGDGGVFAFGDAGYFGSGGAAPAPSSTPVTAMAATADGRGYWITTSAKRLPPATAVPGVLARCTQYGAGPVVRPSSIVLACGDGNASLTGLSWSSWTATTAAATGWFTHNTCTPNCAQGSFVSTPATVRLGYPVETGAGREFGMVSFTYADASAPGGTRTTTGVAPTNAG
jgi:hypothetical protein